MPIANLPTANCQLQIANCQLKIMSFTVAITGRPNVGKSTFFNRLLEQRKAIVDNISGVTRDRQYGVAEWTGRSFNVIDTGGFVVGSDDVFEREIRKQVHIAIESKRNNFYGRCRCWYY